MDAQKHLFVIGNPLLDLQVESSDNTILDKYGLVAGGATLADEKTMPIYDDLWKMDGLMTIPGGSGLNSARSANFMLKNQGSQNKVHYFGSISKDKKGATLEKCLKDEGVIGNFHYSTEAQTGTCAVIVVKKERSMVANLAAACKYQESHLAENMAALENASFIYSTSFFITSNVNALQTVGAFASDKNIPFGYNLSAVFLLQFELANVMKTLQYADFVFGNEHEAEAYATAHKMDGASNVDVAKAIAQSPKKNNQRKRVVIITQGPANVIVATCDPNSEDKNVEIKEFPVEPLAEAMITDTNGAGDAFVGGFVS